MIKNLLSICIKWILIMLSTITILFAQSKGKIYCIGQEFTTGSAMFMPEKNNFPAQLGGMFGKDYQVFLNGKDVVTNAPISIDNHVLKHLDDLNIKKGDFLILDLNHDVDFSQGDDSKLLKNITSSINKGARVVLLHTPSNSYEKQQLSARIQLQTLAFKSNCEIVDLSPALYGGDAYLDKEKRLTSIGASFVAKRLYELIKTPVTGASRIKIKNGKRESFYGFSSETFDFEGKEARVVKPKIVAKGSPWIWRARFWGHEPQLDIAMLERGYHIVYCDVSELFGNEESLQIWNNFYKFLQQFGLNKKAVMEGMSRGGVYIYNWALRYPDRVSAIYADAPVLNFKSWPGGQGKGKGSPENWEIFKQVYKLTEQQALNFKDAPVDRASEIGALKIPSIHVVGDVDDIVPPDENTLPFAKAYIAAGGKLEIIHKPTVGHHPHSLADPTPLVDFLLRADGRKLNFAAIAAAGSEYRSGAGWSPNMGWWGENDDINRILDSKKQQLDILFVGNSITQGIGGTRSHLPYKPGYTAFESVFSSYKWDCAGIAGDRTQHVLWRLINGKYKEAAPKVVVVTIGVNNFLDGDTAEEIVAGILEIKKWIRTNMKNSKLILTGPLPVGVESTDPRRRKYEDIHRLLAIQAKDQCWIYAPLSDTFIKADGNLSLDDYSTDGIHLSGGYTKWAQSLSKIIQKALGE
ncbi:GDSL-type esterase/lipase family protein [Sphingobacterium sp. JUb56]|uniref:GDSL-type esterase/lipase family protein n=1 Tax=Sphingobacterium sp. JUb56 TaxID=2587145 RepID=UPI00160CD3E3|nr:GDSL-type esterase/lipase family protein [Sphingobacterium sp. JUb56]MBB2949541.1 pimeloyl-ACP methyl ester carboxylesterase/lysophospholipase L1-like esterase [Sphingobacterium sp. JUb56]